MPACSRGPRVFAACACTGVPMPCMLVATRMRVVRVGVYVACSCGTCARRYVLCHRVRASARCRHRALSSQDAARTLAVVSLSSCPRPRCARATCPREKQVLCDLPPVALLGLPIHTMRSCRQRVLALCMFVCCHHAPCAAALCATAVCVPLRFACAEKVVGEVLRAEDMRHS